MEEVHVVTCFLVRDRPDESHEVLLLRRGPRVGTYQGRWAGISGYLETEDPLQQAHTELREEAGLGPGDVRLLGAGEPLAVEDPGLGRRWIVHPFLFLVTDPRKIITDWEHVETCWVSPEALANYPTVPGLPDALAAVYPPRPAPSDGGRGDVP